LAQRTLARRGLIAAGAVVIGVALGFAIHVARVGGLEAWLAGSGVYPSDTTAPYVAQGRLVAVDGRSIYLDCRGVGAPTVILEAGLGGGADGWGRIFDDIAGLTRVCAWDRPGIGRSTPRGVHSGADAARDLHAALATAGESGPYIVLAHSLGGMYARLFASTEPGSVAGFVMLDIYEPDLGVAADPALSPELRATLRKNLDEGNASIAASEQLDLAATLAALVPVTREPAVLMAVDQHQRYVDPDPVVTQAMVDAWFRAFSAHYPNGTIEIVPTGHFVHLDRPDLVLAAVEKMVTAQRGSPTATPGSGTPATRGSGTPAASG
jgi:pimeloyl-ACP methyl ester carboxylesterase